MKKIGAAFIGRNISMTTRMRAAILGQRRRFITLGAIFVLAMVSATVALAMSSHSASSVEALEGSTSDLSLVTVYGNADPLPLDVVEQIKAREGVASVSPVIRAAAGLNETRSALVLVGADEEPRAPIIQGEVSGPVPPGAIVLPAVADGVDLSDYLGSEVTLTYSVGIGGSSGVAKEQVFTVTALYDPTYQVEGPVVGYVDFATAQALAAARAGVTAEIHRSSAGLDHIRVRAVSSDVVASVTAELQTGGYHAVSEMQRLQDVPGSIQLLQVVAIGLFALLLMISSAVAVTCKYRGTRRGRLAAAHRQRR